MPKYRITMWHGESGLVFNVTGPDGRGGWEVYSTFRTRANAEEYIRFLERADNV